MVDLLNRGEAVNALKRAIYVGRVASYQAKHHKAMQAVADALSLLANLAWNTMKMQSVLDRWNTRRSNRSGAARPDRAHRPEAHRGHKFSGRVHLPDRAISGSATTVTSAAKSRAFGG